MLIKPSSTSPLRHTSAKWVGRPTHVLVKRAYIPLLLGMSWSIGTILLFAFGPFRYYISNPGILYFYLAAAQVAIMWGYHTGIRAGARDSKWSGSVIKLVSLCLAVSLAKLLFDYAAGIRTLSVTLGFQDPTLARALENLRPGDYLGIFLAPFTYSAIPLTVYYWNRVGRLARSIFLILVLDIVVGSISTATRSGILSLLIFTGVPILLKNVNRTIVFTKKMRYLGIGLLTLSGFLVYGSFITNSRSVTVPYEVRLRARQDAWFDFDHPMYQMLPEGIRSGVLEATYYYTHGYRWLAVSLEKPFIGTAFGAGHSRFLTRNVVRILGSSGFLRQSYFFRLNMEDGMLLSKWITAYPWIASDVTFPGSIIIMWLFGLVLAQSFLDATHGKNPFAVVLCTLLVFQFVSLPQVTITQDGPVVVVFYLMLVLWLKNRAPRRQTDRLVTRTRS